MYVCKYMCMYVDMRVCSHAYADVCKYMCMYIDMHGCAHAYADVTRCRGP